MNSEIIKLLDEILIESKNAFSIKSKSSFENFNYYKGRLVGIGELCKEFKYEEELKEVIKIATEYPFNENF